MKVWFLMKHRALQDKRLAPYGLNHTHASPAVFTRLRNATEIPYKTRCEEYMRWYRSRTVEIFPSSASFVDRIPAWRKRYTRYQWSQIAQAPMPTWEFVKGLFEL